MNVYIYKAALLCEDCGEKERTYLRINGAPVTGDSDTFPQGPYDDGGGEADSPQHCDVCHVFLENPLTHDGFEYVIGKVRAALAPNQIRHAAPSMLDALRTTERCLRGAPMQAWPDGGTERAKAIDAARAAIAQADKAAARVNDNIREWVAYYEITVNDLLAHVKGK